MRLSKKVITYKKNASLRGRITKQSAFLTLLDCFTIVTPVRNDDDVMLFRRPPFTEQYSYPDSGVEYIVSNKG